MWAPLTVHAYASPGYLEVSGEPTRPAQLAQHECLGFAKAGTWELHRGEETVQVEVGGRFMVNSVGMFRRLATLNLGIVLLPREIAASDVAAGRLRRVLPEWEGKSIPVYAMTETRLLPAKVQRFIDFLQERLGQRGA